MAVVVGLAIPRWIPPQFVQEHGPVERGTIWMHLVAVVGSLLMRRQVTPWVDGVAICILLLAAATAAQHLPEAARYAMLSVEELLEFALPLLALLAMAQSRWPARNLG